MRKPTLHGIVIVVVAVALGSAVIATDAVAAGGHGGEGMGGGHFGGAMAGGRFGGGFEAGNRVAIRACDPPGAGVPLVRRRTLWSARCRDFGSLKLHGRSLARLPPAQHLGRGRTHKLM